MTCTWSMSDGKLITARNRMIMYDHRQGFRIGIAEPLHMYKYRISLVDAISQYDIYFQLLVSKHSKLSFPSS